MLTAVRRQSAAAVPFLATPTRVFGNPVGELPAGFFRVINLQVKSEKSVRQLTP